MHTLKDTLLTPLGFQAQRCYQCRSRFYVFNPSVLRGFVKVLHGRIEETPRVAWHLQRDDSSA